MSDISSKISDIAGQNRDERSPLGLKPIELDIPDRSHEISDVSETDIHASDLVTSTDVPSYGWMTAVTILLTALWLIGSSAILYGFFDLGANLSNLSPIAIAGIVTAIFIPALMILLISFALRRLKALSRQAQILSQAAFELTQPDTTLIGKTQKLSQRIKTEIDNLDARMETSIDKVRHLETTLETQKNSIQAASISVTDSAETISIALSRQSDELDRISAKIDAQMTELSEKLSELKSQQDSLTPALDGAMDNAKALSKTIKETTHELETAEGVAKNTLSALSDAATLADTKIKQKFEDMETLVEHSQTRAQDISNTASKRVRESLSETRDEIAQIEADMLALQSKMQDQKADAPSKLKIGNLHLTAVEEESETDTASVETPIIPDIPNTDLEIMSFEDDIPSRQPDAVDSDAPSLSHNLDNFLHRPIEEPPPRQASRWSWRKLLSKADSPAETAAIDQLTNPTPKEEVSTGNIEAALVTLGLTPNAIVDDGCIIEATNIRKSKGEDAMSRTVATRLAEPVMHLKNCLDMDSGLRTSLRDFVAAYRLDISGIASDREIIRTRLESETGRTFLLCDAAING